MICNNLSTYSNQFVANKTVDEIVQDIFRIFRVALNAQYVFSNAKHLYACFLRVREHLRAEWNLPHLFFQHGIYFD